MVSRDGHLYFKISEAKSKFSTTGELMILPTLFITIHTKPRIPLCYSKNMVSVFREIFETAACTAKSKRLHAVSKFIIPVNLKYKLLTGLQCSRQFNPHHSFVDSVV